MSRGIWMPAAYILTIGMFHFLMPGKATYACPGGCKCTSDAGSDPFWTISCTSGSLVRNLPRKIRDATINYTNGEDIPKGFVVNTEVIRRLVINGKLGTIKSGAFNGIYGRETETLVSIETDEIKTIEKFAFQNISQLKNLFFRQKIEHFATMSIVDVRNINLFQFSSMPYVSFSPGTFSSVSNITKFLIGGQVAVGKLPSGVFSGLRYIKRFEITSSSIFHIEKQAFDGLQDVDTVYITNSHISYLENYAFQGMKNVVEFQMWGTSINCLGAYAFTGRVNVLEPTPQWNWPKTNESIDCKPTETTLPAPPSPNTTPPIHDSETTPGIYSEPQTVTTEPVTKKATSPGIFTKQEDLPTTTKDSIVTGITGLTTTISSTITAMLPTDRQKKTLQSTVYPNIGPNIKMDMVIGIVCGTLVLIVLIVTVALTVCCVLKQRQSKPNDSATRVFRDTPNGSGGNLYPDSRSSYLSGVYEEMDEGSIDRLEDIEPYNTYPNALTTSSSNDYLVVVAGDKPSHDKRPHESYLTCGNIYQKPMPGTRVVPDHHGEPRHAKDSSSRPASVYLRPMVCEPGYIEAVNEV